MKKALITGVTGQEGAYLAELPLDRGYEVDGIERRTPLFNTARIDHPFQDRHSSDARFIRRDGDMLASFSPTHIIQKRQPDEICNLAAQRHVAMSFEEPEYAANSDAAPELEGALGVFPLDEAINALKRF